MPGIVTSTRRAARLVSGVVSTTWIDRRAAEPTGIASRRVRVPAPVDETPLYSMLIRSQAARGLRATRPDPTAAPGAGD